MICRHCERAIVCRPRGLCWACYQDEGIRAQHPSTSKFAHRGPGAYYFDAPLPTAPTPALPGTPEKLAILSERVRLGQQLWHPDDATLEHTPQLGRVG